MAASRTAQYVALYRALETTSPSPLFRDELAVRFLSRPLVLAVHAARSRLFRRALERYADHRAPGARTSAIARTAFLDAQVRTAIAAGTRQLVILGAGFDCRAHRMPELAAATVYEVDRHATQAVKRERVGERANLRYVAVDFLRDDTAERLTAAGWDATQPSMLLWEGVTNYLTEAAVASVLAWVGTLPRGSTIAFTYIHRGVLDGSTHFDGAAAMRDNVARLGEPWQYGIHPDELAPLLARHGLTVRENLGADEYRERYLGPGFRGYGFYRICVADVTTR